MKKKKKKEREEKKEKEAMRISAAFIISIRAREMNNPSAVDRNLTRGCTHRMVEINFRHFRSFGMRRAKRIARVQASLASVRERSTTIGNPARDTAASSPSS